MVCNAFPYKCYLHPDGLSCTTSSGPHYITCSYQGLTNGHNNNLFQNWKWFFFLAKWKSWERERDSGPTVPAKWRTALWELKQINPNFMSKFESVPSCKMFNVHIGKLIVAMHFNKGKTNDICFWKWFSRFGGFFSSNFQVVFHLLPDVVYLHIYDYAVYILIRMKAHNQQLQGQLSSKVSLYPQAMWYSD